LTQEQVVSLQDLYPGENNLSIWSSMSLENCSLTFKDSLIKKCSLVVDEFSKGINAEPIIAADAMTCLIDLQETMSEQDKNELTKLIIIIWKKFEVSHFVCPKEWTCAKLFRILTKISIQILPSLPDNDIMLILDSMDAISKASQKAYFNSLVIDYLASINDLKLLLSHTDKLVPVWSRLILSSVSDCLLELQIMTKAKTLPSNISHQFGSIFTEKLDKFKVCTHLRDINYVIKAITSGFSSQEPDYETDEEPGEPSKPVDDSLKENVCNILKTSIQELERLDSNSDVNKIYLREVTDKIKKLVNKLQ
jgi:hypothetical protein